MERRRQARLVPQSNFLAMVSILCALLVGHTMSTSVRVVENCANDPGSSSSKCHEETRNSSRNIKVREFRNNAVTLLQLGLDWSSCMLNASDAIEQLRYDSNDTGKLSQDVVNMWNFLETHAKKSEAVNASHCAKTSSLFCRPLYVCNKSCQACQDDRAYRESVDKVCLNLRYNHAILQPSLDSGRGDLKAWFLLLEEQLCGLTNYSCCSEPTNTTQQSFHRFVCPYPLRKTSVSSRQSMDFKKDIKTALTYFQRGDGNASLDGFDIYPCGDHCDQVDPASWRTKFVDNITRLSGIIQIVMSFIAAMATVRTGLGDMCQYPNRLQLHLLMAVFFFSLFLVPHVFLPATGRPIACNDDKTAQELDNLKKDSSCVFTFIVSTMGGMMFQLITLYVAISWWQLVLKLKRVSKWYVIRMDGKVEVLWLLGSIIWSVVIVIVQYKDKEPLVPFLVLQFCISLYTGSEFITYTPYVMFASISFLVLIDGLRRMRRVRHSSVRFRKNCGLRKQRLKGDRAMTTILNHLKRYIIGLFLIGAIEITFRFIDPPGKADTTVFDQRAEYQKCMVGSCGNFSRCQSFRPQIPDHRIAVNFLFDAFSAVLAVLICSWALNPKVWRRQAIEHRHKLIKRSTFSKAIVSNTVNSAAGFALSSATLAGSNKQEGSKLTNIYQQTIKQESFLSQLNSDSTESVADSGDSRDTSVILNSPATKPEVHEQTRPRQPRLSHLLENSSNRNDSQTSSGSSPELTPRRTSAKDPLITQSFVKESSL